MTRLVVGPFNRVEGDLELTLDVDGGVVTQARVTTPLYRGFEQLLVGRPVADALVVAPRICGICSVSQSIAAAGVLRALDRAVPARNGLIAANLAHAAENIADHLTHFYVFFMPDFARAEYAGRTWFAAAERRFKAMRGEAAADVLPARARLLEIMGLIAGKWPHSLAFQPGGVTRGLDLGDKMRLIAILADFRDFFERCLLGASIDDFLALETEAALDSYAQGAAAAADFPAFVRIARDLALDRLGALAAPLMSFGAYHFDAPHFAAGVFDPVAATGAPLPSGAIAEDVAHSWLRETARDPAEAQTVPQADKPDAYSWAKSPRLAGRPVEVGAVARQAVDGDPLTRALLAAHGGTNVFARVVARIRETARLIRDADEWARALKIAEPFCSQAAPVADGRALALVEAARGALGHWMEARGGLITRYQIIAPTTWNFSPRDSAGAPGPVEAALQGVDVGAAGARAAAVQHVVRSFDPCMVCTAH